MKIWILDDSGYDSMGGSATVFSTLERAKAAAPHVEWEWDEGQRWWSEVSRGVCHCAVIYEVEVDAEDEPEPEVVLPSETPSKHYGDSTAR